VRALWHRGRRQKFLSGWRTSRRRFPGCAEAGAFIWLETPRGRSPGDISVAERADIDSGSLGPGGSGKALPLRFPASAKEMFRFRRTKQPTRNPGRRDVLVFPLSPFPSIPNLKTSTFLHWGSSPKISVLFRRDQMSHESTSRTSEPWNSRVEVSGFAPPSDFGFPTSLALVRTQADTTPLVVSGWNLQGTRMREEAVFFFGEVKSLVGHCDRSSERNGNHYKPP